MKTNCSQNVGFHFPMSLQRCSPADARLKGMAVPQRSCTQMGRRRWPPWGEFNGIIVSLYRTQAFRSPPNAGHRATNFRASAFPITMMQSGHQRLQRAQFSSHLSFLASSRQMASAGCAKRKQFRFGSSVGPGSGAAVP